MRIAKYTNNGPGRSGEYRDKDKKKAAKQKKKAMKKAGFKTIPKKKQSTGPVGIGACNAKNKKCK